MAPPPKYVITRKLIGHFFKTYLPNSPIIISNDSTKLFDCWKEFGLENPKCDEFEELYDLAHNKIKNYSSRVEALKLKSAVLSHLKRPEYKNEKKGRFKEAIFDKKKDIFDGLY